MLLAIMPGTPMEFYNKMSDFGAQRTIYHNDPVNYFHIYSVYLFLAQFILIIFFFLLKF